jgi:hypothetical protein
MLRQFLPTSFNSENAKCILHFFLGVGKQCGNLDLKQGGNFGRRCGRKGTEKGVHETSKGLRFEQHFLG